MKPSSKLRDMGVVRRRIAWGTLFLLLAAGHTVAQTGSGSIHGQVQDQTGAAVPSPSVAAVSADGMRTPGTSNRDGSFDIRGLRPGTYRVEATVAGFAPFTKEGVTVTANQTAQLPITLAIQTQTEQITVNGGDAPVALDVTPSNNASALVLTEDELAALPDDPDELESDLTALAGPSPGPNGGQMYIDGFTAGQLPPKSSIREIRVNSNPFSAEYDRVGYGRIEIFTKPGTDKWRSQIFVNANDSFLNSKDPFAPFRPNFESVQVNGNIGGPLGKKASIFINTDYRDIHNQNVISAYTGLDGQNNPIFFNTVVPSPHTRVNVGPRLDYQISKNNTLSIRYQYYYDNQQNFGVGVLNLPTTGYNKLTTEHTVQISDTQVIGTKIINETHFQFLNDDANTNPTSLATGVQVLGAFVGGGYSKQSIVDTSRRYEFQNYTSVALAKHFIKFGGRLRVGTDSNSTTSGFNGFFTFPTLMAYAAGTPNQFAVTVGAPLARLTTEDTGLYVEDDWRLRPNFTLSYGLRFETQAHINDHADWAPRVGIAWGLGKAKTSPKTVIRAGVGVFYDRFGGTQILQAERQGFGGAVQQEFIFANPTATVSSVYTDCGTSVQTVNCQNDISSLEKSPSNTPTFYQIAPNLHAPYSLQTAVSVERQLTKIANLSVSYLHTSGYDQLDTDNVNSPYQLINGVKVPMIPTAQNSAHYANNAVENIYQYQSQGIFRENQLIVNVNVRAGAKINVNGYYTLSYANADTGGVGSFPSNPYDIMADYGRAAFDVRHRGFLSGTVILPWDLHLSPFMVVSSGEPYNITVGQDLIGSSILNQRPAFASCTGGAGIVSTQLGCFNINPGPGANLVPINYLIGGPGFTLNLRLSKVFGFGKVAETNTNRRNGGGGGGPRGGPGGRGPGGPGGGGGFGIGGRGPGGGNASANRYTFTLSANARNIFNTVNYGNYTGNLQSPLFGRPDELAGGAFSQASSGANRQVYLELQFGF